MPSLLNITNLRKIVNAKQVGDAGEFEVAKQLCRVGVNATVTKAGSTGVDLFAELEGRSATVQVKTRKTVAAGIHKHDMKPHGMTADFVVFVALNWCDAKGEELVHPPHPTCYVLPRDVALEAWDLGGRSDGCYEKRPNLVFTPEVRDVIGRFQDAWYVIRDHLEQS